MHKCKTRSKDLKVVKIKDAKYGCKDEGQLMTIDDNLWQLMTIDFGCQST